MICVLEEDPVKTAASPLAMEKGCRFSLPPLHLSPPSIIPFLRIFGRFLNFWMIFALKRRFLENVQFPSFSVQEGKSPFFPSHQRRLFVLLSEIA